MAIVEPELEEASAVDDKNLLDLVPFTSSDTFEDVQVNPGLTQEQKDEVPALLLEFADIFTDQPGTTALAQHVITTTTSEPIMVKQYPMPFAKRQAVEDEIKMMLEAGVRAVKLALWFTSSPS